MNYEVLGSIGFAQYGSINHFTAKQVEKHVLREFLKGEQFNIPEEFEGMARIAIKNFPYEDSSYDEVCLIYDDDLFEEWEEEHDNMVEEAEFDEDDCQDEVDSKFNRFWAWFRTLENIEFENDELMSECKKIFAEKNPMEVIHRREKENNLKIA